MFLGGASKNSWVESAGLVWFRSWASWPLAGCFDSYSTYLKHCAKKGFVGFVSLKPNLSFWKDFGPEEELLSGHPQFCWFKR